MNLELSNQEVQDLITVLGKLPTEANAWPLPLSPLRHLKGGLNERFN